MYQKHLDNLLIFLIYFEIRNHFELQTHTRCPQNLLQKYHYPIQQPLQRPEYPDDAAIASVRSWHESWIIIANTDYTM